jgi:hypothetical protein
MKHLKTKERSKNSFEIVEIEMIVEEYEFIIKGESGHKKGKDSEVV